MDKFSNEGHICVHCEKDALPGTMPPVCEEHMNIKTASENNEEAINLKELENNG